MIFCSPQLSLKEEATMKRFIGLLTVLIMISAAGPIFGGERERHGVSESGHQGEYESKIYGTIRKLPAGMIGLWDVNGREVSVTNATYIKEKHGRAEVGAYVEIEGNYSGRTFVASKIEVKRARQ